MMMILRGIFWITVYAAVAVAPLAVALLAPADPNRTLITELSVALGFLGLSIMVLQFGLVARLQRVSAPLGMDSLHQYHRQISYVALAFVLVHPAMLIIEDPAKLYLLNPYYAPNRARFAVTAVVLLLLLIATSVWRRRLRLGYETWQLIHGVLAVGVVVFSLLHMDGVGYYVARPWQRLLWYAMSALLVGLVSWVLVFKPLGQLRRPWKVHEVRDEGGRAWSVVLTPDGHDGMRFEPGQFGWLVVDRSPFTLSQHPFSFSSSAEAGAELTMTIKARGDFTRTIAGVPPGTRAYVDGPYGMFTPDRNEGFGFVLIAGGVGIPPLVSMLRTFADRGDRRPCYLFYGSKDPGSIIFQEEIEALSERLALTVVHALEKARTGLDRGGGIHRCGDAPAPPAQAVSALPLLHLWSHADDGRHGEGAGCHRRPRRAHHHRALRHDLTGSCHATGLDYPLRVAPPRCS